MQYDRNDCTVTDSVVVELIQARPLTLSPDTTVCISVGSLQLDANLDGGTWSGDDHIDPATGLIDVESTRGRGETFVYQYTYQPGTSCEQIDKVTVTSLTWKIKWMPAPMNRYVREEIALPWLLDFPKMAPGWVRVSLMGASAK